MLEYGTQDHGPYERGIGDWGERIQSGRVRPAQSPEPAEVVPELEAISRSWHYL